MPDALQHSIDVGVAALTLPGETESGDLHVVSHFPGGFVVAAIDGLGHGPEAAAAASSAAAVVQSHPDLGVVELIEACDRALLRTRGAVMTVASVDLRTSEMTWLGVGNIETVLVRAEPGEERATESAMLLGGIVGHNLPALRASTLEIGEGDTLVFASDGVRTSFIPGLDASGDVQEVANRILERHGKGTDDALVVVARYRGA
ncbi:MAG: SpoIIE family protein phosphatase [Thermoleophilaceae bacterium]